MSFAQASQKVCKKLSTLITPRILHTHHYIFKEKHLLKRVQEVNLMTNKKVVVCACVLFALFFGAMETTGVGFTQTPIYIDPGGDSLPECSDILKVWIANNATCLQVKLELNGSVNQYLYPFYGVLISIDNSTGMNLGWDLPMDYSFELFFLATGELGSHFSDLNNATNDHFSPLQAGLEYYLLSNNNHTLEMGYKLQTADQADQGRGFLNVSIGQTIYLKLQDAFLSDSAPDSSLLIRYVLTEEGGIPGFDLPFLSLAMLVSVMVFVIAKKKTPI